jgi:hypothetical protein
LDRIFDVFVAVLMIVNLTEEAIEMNMPTFTADAALYNGATRYHSVAKGSAQHGGVQPAFSSVLSSLHKPLCLRYICPEIWDPRTNKKFPFLCYFTVVDCDLVT